MKQWSTIPAGDCLVHLHLPKSMLKTKDYRRTGAFPIIDQGKSYIAGWTDATDGLIESALPVVVFGDHTRNLKFVDFPFIRGADGTQILKPDSRFDVRFFYFALKAVRIEGRGYNRHLSELKTIELPVPPLDEQCAISRPLALLEHLIQDELLVEQITLSLKRIAMRELFKCGLRGKAQQLTDIGPLPEAWETVTINDCFAVSSGGTPSRSMPEYWNGGSIPWVKTTEIDYRIIYETEERITIAGLEASAAKILPIGTLLMAMYGQGATRGRVAMLGIQATCNQACAALIPKNRDFDSRFYFYYLTYRYEAIRQLAHGGQQQNLNLDIVRSINIPLPPLAEQREIVEILEAIDRKIDLHRRKKALLEELFKSLLHKLMSGEVEVGKLGMAEDGVLAKL